MLDINGWDIKKALQLLHNSNPTVFESCNGITAIRVLTDTVGARILRCRVMEM